MSASSFEKTNFGWRLSQLRQEFGEWWEFQTSQFRPNIPQLSVPSWFNSPLLNLLAKVIFGIIVALLLTWVGWLLWRGLRPYILSFIHQLKSSTPQTTPTPTQDLSVTRWLQRSQKFQQQGNYREACRCLYMAMLQRLHDKGLVPHQSSRTDGEYLRIIQQLPQPQPYQTLLNTHQQLCFSHTEISSTIFEQCQQAYREIDV
jgi:hypothetical protein